MTCIFNLKYSFMALINCKECGQEISDTANVCPHCGAPVVKDVFCVKCGTKVPENVKFCPSCGAPVAKSGTAAGARGKDKTVAGLLAIFLGYLGIQYFYLGKTTAGILSIVISLCSCGVWSIVTLIQGILMLTMAEDDFNTKYVDNDKTFPLF